MATIPGACANCGSMDWQMYREEIRGRWYDLDASTGSWLRDIANEFEQEPEVTIQCGQCQEEAGPDMFAALERLALA